LGVSRAVWLCTAVYGFVIIIKIIHRTPPHLQFLLPLLRQWKLWCHQS
jgi:hypothetical protein